MKYEEFQAQITSFGLSASEFITLAGADPSASDGPIRPWVPQLLAAWEKHALLLKAAIARLDRGGDIR